VLTRVDRCNPVGQAHLTPHRLPVGEFKPRRDQRSACHRWNRFVLGDEYVKEAAKLYPKSKSEKAKHKHDFDLVSAVHDAEFAKVGTPPDPAHRFEVALEPDDFTQEKYDLYLNYQVAVHHDNSDELSPTSFRRFLCDSPLYRTEDVVNGAKKTYGSFHQMYRLDGRLIAIGVIDILPDCVNGVYFIYHSDFEKWSFGKLSALREACLALEGGYNYYYMGYYIHSCPKMWYKNDYHPQYFLDIKTLQWDPLDQMNQRLMDKHHFMVLSDLRKRATEEHVDIFELNDTHDPSLTGAAVVKLHRQNRISLFDLGFAGMLTLAQLKESGVSIGSILQQDDEGAISPLVVSPLFVKWEPYSYDL
jgi:arginine-tRNA-protein transferase